MSTEDPTQKPAGQGKGRWTQRGVQAQQSSDIEQLKSLVSEMAAQLDALEAGQPTPESGLQNQAPETPS